MLTNKDDHLINSFGINNSDVVNAFDNAGVFSIFWLSYIAKKLKIPNNLSMRSYKQEQSNLEKEQVQLFLRHSRSIDTTTQN